MEELLQVDGASTRDFRKSSSCKIALVADQREPMATWKAEKVKEYM